MLLERSNVNPGKADKWSQTTPLLWAAEDGHVRAVGMLLEQNGVNPNITDTKHGRTPFSWAAKNGHGRL